MKRILLASAMLMTFGPGIAFASYGPSAFTTWVSEGANGKPLTPLSQMSRHTTLAATRTGAISTRYYTAAGSHPAGSNVMPSHHPAAMGGNAKG